MGKLTRLMRHCFPGFAALCDRHGMVADSEGEGPRGEWSVLMRCSGFRLSIGMEILYPRILIWLRRDGKRRGFVGKILRELGLWEGKITLQNERDVADVLEANLERVLAHLEKEPSPGGGHPGTSRSG